MSEGNGSTKAPLKREPLIAPRIKQAEFANTLYRAYPEKGVTIDEIKEPKYWSHVASMLKQYDKVEVIEETGAYFAELLITGCDRNWATVEVIHFKALREKSAEESEEKAPTVEEYRVAHRGPHHKWRVERVSDGKVLHHGAQTKLEADAWLEQHRGTLAKFVAA